MLYLVPTPIGNLEDMTFRAVNVLKEVSLILAEDTRTSRPLLNHFDIHTPLQAHHLFNEHQSVESIVQRLKTGEDIALITDAGTPGISDPGFLFSFRTSTVIEAAAEPSSSVININKNTLHIYINMLYYLMIHLIHYQTFLFDQLIFGVF